MKSRVYLETSVISYHAARPSRDVVAAARQQLTQDWWQTRLQYDLYVSRLVELEASRGDRNAAAERMAAIAGVPRLDIDKSIETLADELVSAHAIPVEYAEDALHIAIAAVHCMDFLLTWNCKHIANAHIRPHVIRTVDKAGYSCPIICTPEQLLGGESS